VKSTKWQKKIHLDSFGTAQSICFRGIIFIFFHCWDNHLITSRNKNGIQ